MPGFRRLLGFVRPYTSILALTLVATIVASVLDGFTFALLIPFLRLLFGPGPGILSAAPTAVERVLDFAVGFALSTEHSKALRNVVLFIIGTVAVKNVAVYAAGSLGARIQEGVGRDMRTTLYSHIQQLGLGFFHRMKSGQLVSRVIADVEQAGQVVSATLVSATQNVILVGVYLVILFSLSWRLTLLTLLLAPTIALLMRPILQRIRLRVRGTLHDRGEVAAIMSETVEGARLVKAHNAEDYERRRFEGAVASYFNGIVKARKLAVLAHPVSETLGAGVILLLLVFGMSAGSEAGSGMRPELFIPFMAITLRLLSPVKALSQFPVSAEMSLAAAARVFEILDEPPDDIDLPKAMAFPGIREEVSFSHVWHAYEPGKWVLEDVCLTVSTGEVVAIVGPSGAGKSTLMDLLPRFIEPTRGDVLVDGVPISNYSRKSLRRAMGIVSQHTVIFNDSVRANIAYGEEENATSASVEAAAKAANAHEFIEQLPQGYHTTLGERGMRLSGGERQRIAIARALLRDPPILILDEATSALDTESERLVQEAIERLMENRTVLVIAHRLSTVVRASQIVVLQRGRLIERGRHDELAAAGGLYQRLHDFDVLPVTRTPRRSA
jgi:subfamily B ATP-binding cassette protein MsbA